MADLSASRVLRTVDAVLGMEHGERDPEVDPLPHVSATGEHYCLCGRPNYLECLAEEVARRG